MNATPVAEYTPNQLNQDSSIGATNRVHDADGNLTDDGTLLYTWDADNRLVQVNLKSDNTLISKDRYDHAGRRVLKQVFSAASGGTMGETVFLCEGWNLALEYPALWAVVDGDEPPRRAYSWGNDLSGSRQGAGGVGGLLAIEERGGAHEGFHYPLYDGNSNVTQLVKSDASGGTTVTAHYEYGPFGNLTTSPARQNQKGRRGQAILRNLTEMLFVVPASRACGTDAVAMATRPSCNRPLRWGGLQQVGGMGTVRRNRHQHSNRMPAFALRCSGVPCCAPN